MIYKHLHNIIKRTKNLRDLPGGDNIVNDKVKKQQPSTKQGDAVRVIVRKTRFGKKKREKPHNLLVTKARNSLRYSITLIAKANT